MNALQLLQRYGDWLALHRGLSDHTVRAYLHTLRRLHDQLVSEGAGLRRASTSQVRHFLFLAGRGRSASTRARHVAALRSFYDWAVEQQVVERSPVDHLRSPQVPSTLPTVVSVRQTEELMVGAGLSTRDAAMLELLYGAALRVSELAALDVDDVDLREALVHVRDGKGGRPRVVPMGAQACRAVQEWLEQRPVADDKAMWLNRHGVRLSVRSIRRVVKEAGRRTGVPGMHPHALRHACATHMLGAGADLRAIQEQLGHRTLSTTQRYTRVSVDHLRAVHDKAHPHSSRGPKNPVGAFDADDGSD